MKREFNETGICIPGRHFMVDMTSRMSYAMELIDAGKYFCINRPRQYGKTTLLSHLTKHIRQERQDDYLLARISFEGLGDSAFETEQAMSNAFLRQVQDNLDFVYGDSAFPIHDNDRPIANFEMLSKHIARVVSRSDRRIVILIDEVDRAGNFDMFLRFLGTLRNMYLNAMDGNGMTFHSVILAGLHDVKSLKLKIRGGDEPRFNSPWNIAVNFDIDMSFNADEIAVMLRDYASDRGVEMDEDAIAASIRDYTSGYPFLVSAMCKMVDEKFKRHDRWTVEDIDQAFLELTRPTYSNTNFDDLAKTLQRDEDLYQLVHAVLFQNEVVRLSSKDPVESLAMQYGILAESTEGARVHNRIYEACIVDQMTSRMLRERRAFPNTLDGRYLADHDRLDFRELLLGYQRFMKEHQSDKDRRFLEREGRLIFLAFLKPIINGHGHCFKEPVIGNERRMDLVVTYYDQREVVELKVWRGQKYHEAGLKQLCAYLDHCSVNRGYLLIYDLGQDKSFREETIEFEGKTIVAVWV